VDRFADFLEANGMPSAVASLTREHVEMFMAHLLAHRKPATAANRYRSLQGFFRWLVEDGGVTESPMRNMRSPIIPETPVPVLSVEGEISFPRLLGRPVGLFLQAFSTTQTEGEQPARVRDGLVKVLTGLFSDSRLESVTASQ
jgi:site-specific recombinase XerD